MRHERNGFIALHWRITESGYVKCSSVLTGVCSLMSTSETVAVLDCDVRLASLMLAGSLIIMFNVCWSTGYTTVLKTVIGAPNFICLGNFRWQFLGCSQLQFQNKSLLSTFQMLHSKTVTTTACASVVACKKQRNGMWMEFEGQQ